MVGVGMLVLGALLGLGSTNGWQQQELREAGEGFDRE